MKDGFKSATIIATLNLLSWKKDYRIWSVGTVIMVLIIRYLIGVPLYALPNGKTSTALLLPVLLADATPIALEISFDSRYSPGLHRNKINLSYELFRSSHNPNVYTAESRTITAALKRSNISSSISFSKLPIIRILYCNSIITDSHTFAINNTTIKAIITGNRFAPMQRCKSIFSSFKR